MAAAARYSYADVPALISLMTGDSRHDAAAESGQPPTEAQGRVRSSAT